ncbi:uncharacterized protein LOC135808978 [Sycon ciliatum]|uniref:uncharacterized protein LOC135808978 n=1 Tax=Sycon ciliatum TaxID=27933 RepID=UPI0020AB115F|eukprot:scpid19601/ scgid20724/ 
MAFLRTLAILLLLIVLLQVTCGQKNNKKRRKPKTSLNDDDTDDLGTTGKVKRRRRNRQVIVYDGEEADATCEDCLCLVHYTLVCPKCAPQLDLLVPCGTTVMDLMMKAANVYDSKNPNIDPSNNPYSFTTEYRGKGGQSVVGLNGIIPEDHEWQLFINSRYVGTDIKTTAVRRGGESVTFRLIPVEVKRSLERNAQRDPMAMLKDTQVEEYDEAPEQELDVESANQLDTTSRENTEAVFDNAMDIATENEIDADLDVRSPDLSSDEDLSLAELNSLQEKFESLWPFGTGNLRSPPSASRQQVWHLFDRILQQLKKCAQYASDLPSEETPPPPPPS